MLLTFRADPIAGSRRSAFLLYLLVYTRTADMQSAPQHGGISAFPARFSLPNPTASTMATLHPFRAVRPDPEHVLEIASVPYDVINTEEARELAVGTPA